VASSSNTFFIKVCCKIYFLLYLILICVLENSRDVLKTHNMEYNSTLWPWITQILTEFKACSREERESVITCLPVVSFVFAGNLYTVYTNTRTILETEFHNSS
jgi:hypothetical protein